jgi:hypothetical protein
MRIEVSIDARGVVARIVGAVSATELEEGLHALAVRPDFAAAMPTIWDFTHATATSSIGSDALRRLGALSAAVRRAAPAARTAFVTPRDADYGVARQYQGLMSGRIPVQVGVFKTLAEAEAWAFAAEGAEERGAAGG